MNSIFQTGIDATLPANLMLCIQAGPTHFSYSLSNRTGDELYRLNYFSVKEWNTEAIELLLKELPSKEADIQGVEIAYESGEFTMVPVAGFQESKLMALHKALYPHAEQSVYKTESLAAWQLYIGYTASATLFNALLARYPDARIRHFLKLALQQAEPSGTQGRLLVNIRPNHFFAVLLRNNRFQFAREFFYETPADVLYYLLRVCEDHLISPNEVEIELTGLIDQESALFVELWQYFTQLRIRPAYWKTEQTEFPAHYFTQLNDLVKCAL